MNRIHRTNALTGITLASLLAVTPSITGCSGDDAASDSSDSSDASDSSGGSGGSGTQAGEGGTASGGSEGNPSGGSAGGGGEAPVGGSGGSWFAVPTEVYAADFLTSVSYVPLVPSLDVGRIRLDAAKELDGRASVARVGDWLFVAGSSEPVVTRYSVDEDGSLHEDGRLNFSNYGVPEFFAIDAWGAVFVNAEKAYVFNGSDGSHVIWNPTTLEITGEIPGPEIVEEGYNLESIAVIRGNRMYRIFTFLNYETWEFLAEPQYLAVYDVEQDELLDLVQETRCPQLYNRPFIDESGDIYFSGWVWTPGLTLTGDYPKSCALRVKAGEDSFDPAWQLDFAEAVTDGREAGMLRYLGDGKALLDVFHDERVEIDADTDAQELVNTANWRLWTVDLEDLSGAPIEAFDYKAGGYTDVQVDGRTFLMVPNEDYSETTAYEIVEGQAIEGFKIEGSSYQVVRAR